MPGRLTVALLPSPLLGPAVWEPVAAVLRDGARDVLVADPRERPPATPADVLAAFERAVPDGVALVAHSNAGLFVPALTELRRVAAVVFVDAGLPPPGPAEVPAAPPAFREFLAGLAGPDGLLPPWTRWWEEDVSALFGDDEVRERVEREQRRLPLSYFDGTLTVPAGWDDRPCAYLAFGETYADETAGARARGWPVRVLPGDHLEMTVHPAVVAAEVAALLPG